MIRNVSSLDVKKISHLHYTELKGEFLPSLGRNFLEKLYKGLIKEKGTFILALEEKNALKGFLVGSFDFKQSFKKIIRDNFFNFSKGMG